MSMEIGISVFERLIGTGEVASAFVQLPLMVHRLRV
jgi:hypothetical protein